MMQLSRRKRSSHMNRSPFFTQNINTASVVKLDNGHRTTKRTICIKILEMMRYKIYKQNATEKKNNGAVMFGMAWLFRSRIPNDFSAVLPENGSPFSGIEFDLFNRIEPYALPEWYGLLYVLYDAIVNRLWWQYGISNHSSTLKEIKGCVMLRAVSYLGSDFSLKHIIIQGSLK